MTANADGPAWLPGIELARALYEEAVRPILDRRFPGLVHAAALLGPGSEVLGLDDARSTDHGWGPRLQLFLSDGDVRQHRDAIQDVLAAELPPTIRGWSTNFGPPDAEGTRLPEPVDGPPIAHRVEVRTLARFLGLHLGVDATDDLGVRDWLVVPSQALASITGGAVFHDPAGDLAAVRGRLDWYPHDVWLHLLACQWRRVAQEEPFVGRTGEVGDDLGSRVLAARLTRDLVRLCFLIDRRHAPYGKWMGTVFRRLPSAATVGPQLDAALAAVDWDERQTHLARAAEQAGAAHNTLGVTAAVDPTPRPFHDRPFLVVAADRFATACRDAITDPDVRALPAHLGSIDQLVDSTDVLRPDQAWKLRTLWE